MNKIIACGVLLVMVLATTAWGKVGGGDITFSLKGASNVVYSHDDHIMKNKLKCGECHYRLYAHTSQRMNISMEAMQKGQSCGACHNGQRAFDVKGACNKCHP